MDITTRDKWLLGGAAVAALAVVLTHKDAPPGTDPGMRATMHGGMDATLSGAPWPADHPATQTHYGANNFAKGGAGDRFAGMEAALEGTSFAGDPSFAQYAGLPFSNTAGGLLRHQPGIEFMAGLADQTTLAGVAGIDRYQGDNPLAFMPAWIVDPPWRK
jgi:hypothetical protein